MKHHITLGLAILILHAGLAGAQESETESMPGRLLWSYDAGG